MEMFKDFSKTEKLRLFYSPNHTNPLLDKNSPESIKVKNAGFNIAEQSNIYTIANHSFAMYLFIDSELKE